MIKQFICLGYSTGLRSLPDSLVYDPEVQTEASCLKILVSVSARGEDGVASVGVDAHSQSIQVSSSSLSACSSVSGGVGYDLVAGATWVMASQCLQAP